MKRLRVLFCTPEFADYIQIGGLGAVSSALPRALRSIADVRVILPGYPQVLNALRSFEFIADCPALASLPACSLWRSSTVDGLPVYVVVCPELYERDGGPYGDARGVDWPDNDIRFARYASAAACLADGGASDWRADLVHANDWQCGLIPAYLAWRGSSVRSLFTVHNLAYQGLFSRESVDRLGVPASAFSMHGVEFHGHMSFMKSGLFYSSHISTVSANYASEIVTSEHGCGLDGLLRVRAGERRLTGILNGIDGSWDPRHCPDLKPQFAPGEWKGRHLNALSVRREFGLALTRGPLFGLVARLVHQKGVDLVVQTSEAIAQAGGQLVIMGAGDPDIVKDLEQVRRRHPRSVGVTTQFSDSLQRRMFAGSDFTLLPSRFEPCGLSQMYAQRLGSLPIAHNTGGLADTIADGRTGLLFNRASSESFLGAICRAFALYGRKREINAMRRRAMACDYGWNKSASIYGSLYEHVQSA
jgi:starch synthase